MLRKIRSEHARRRIGAHRTHHRRHFPRRHAFAFQRQFERRVARLPGILAVEPVHELPPFTVGKAREVGASLRMFRIVEQRRRDRRLAVREVIGDLAHQSHEHEVHGVLQRVFHRQDAIVVVAIEVRERLRAAAGEERLIRTRRVSALHRRLQRAGQIRTGILDQIFDHPRRQPVLVGHMQRAQFRRTHADITIVRFLDQFEIRHQRAELRSRTKVDARAGVDVERLLEAVGIDPQQIAARAALVQREAVDHFAGIARAEQVIADQAELVQRRRIFEAR